MWTLLRFDRNRVPVYHGNARGRYAHDNHQRAHRHPAYGRGHAQDPLVACCNPTDKIVTCGTVSIAIGILAVIYSTYEMHKAAEFYDNSGQILVPPPSVETPPDPPRGTTPPNHRHEKPSTGDTAFTLPTLPTLPTALPHDHNSTQSSTQGKNSSAQSSSAQSSPAQSTPAHLQVDNSTQPNTMGGTARKIVAKQYNDKYGSEISQEKFEYLLGQEQIDKGLCVALTFLGIIQVVSSGLLIRGAKIGDKRSHVPWMIIALTLMCLGLVYVLFNVVTLDFNASVNFVLFLWIVVCVVEFHCLKNVFRAFRGERAEAALQEGSAVFDPRQLSNDVFTITNGQIRPAQSPVRIMLKPPSYEEATSALDELGPPPDPPDEGDKDIDKPPEYTP